MDKTYKYIMLANNPDIQSYRKNKDWEDGDMVALWVEEDRKYNVFMYTGCVVSEGIIESEIHDPNCIWLPNINQLLVIAFPDPRDTINIQCNKIVNQFALEEYYLTGCTATYLFETWEQLLLAFVMKERFAKTLINGEWIRRLTKKETN
jgi:hypothetical protein